MPVSVFDGASTTELHEHFDADGVLTGTTVVTRPSPWTDDDRAWALALAEREGMTCKGCGHDLVETLDYDSWIWEPDLPLVCGACVAIDVSREKQRQANNPGQPGMIHRVKKRPRPKRPKPRRKAG